MILTRELGFDLIALNEAVYGLAISGTSALPAGFSAPEPIVMPEGAGPWLIRNDPYRTWGYVTTRNGQTFVVFRGTLVDPGPRPLAEWLLDSECLPLVKVNCGAVHRGFNDLFKALQGATIEAVTKKAGSWGDPIITGHSLGGATANRCRSCFGGDLITFNAPLVGNAEYAATMPDAIRVVNRNDMVHLMPHIHCVGAGKEIVLDGPGSPLHMRVSHSLESIKAGWAQYTEAA